MAKEVKLIVICVLLILITISVKANWNPFDFDNRDDASNIIPTRQKNAGTTQIGYKNGDTILNKESDVSKEINRFNAENGPNIMEGVGKFVGHNVEDSKFLTMAQQLYELYKTNPQTITVALQGFISNWNRKLLG